MVLQHQIKENNIDESLPQYKCDDCPYTTYFKWNLKAHKRKHKIEKQFKCEQCSYSTAYKHNYLNHSKVHNKKEVIYKCDKCPFVTKYEGHISRHLAKIHDEVSDQANKCDYCDFSTKLRWRLNIHKSKSKQKSVLDCSYCEFKTIYKCESKKHKVTHYSEIYGKKQNENNEEIHVPRDENIETNLNQEITLDASNSESCITMPDELPDLTNQTTQKKSNDYTLDPTCEVDWQRIQVMESTSKDRQFQCIKCSYTSRFKASVQRHFQRHHTGSNNRPYKCCNCDFSTKTKDQIGLHNKRSQSEVQLLCKECKFSTFFKCEFVMHQKNHYPHKCTICNYTCKHKYEIQKHFTVIHLGNGLKCRFCDYKATRKESLLCHETIHTGNKPFKCSHCDYESVRKSLLDNHLKRYHGDTKKDKVVVSESKIQTLKIPIVDEIKKQKFIEDMLNPETFMIDDIADSKCKY